MDCTGCFACYNSCPVDAIEFIEDEYGFVNPIIDENTCIDCNRCSKVCPELNNNDNNYRNPIRVLATSTKNDIIRSKSTSGGIATELAIEIINNNGVVYGAAVCENATVKHIRVERIEDVYKSFHNRYFA